MKIDWRQCQLRSTMVYMNPKHVGIYIIIKIGLRTYINIRKPLQYKYENMMPKCAKRCHVLKLKRCANTNIILNGKTMAEGNY